MSRPFLDAYSASISDSSIWHCQFKNTLSDFLSAVGVSRHVDLINVTQLESRFHYLDHCGYNMRNKGPIQLYWVNSRLFASFHLFKRCRFSFSWWDWKLLLTVMIQMHQGQHVKRCSIDSRRFVEAHRPEVVQRFIYFFHYFFLSVMQVSANTPSMYSQELFQLSQYLQVWNNTDLYRPSADIKCQNAKFVHFMYWP